MPLVTVLTIAGTPYDAAARVAVPVLATSLQRTLDGGYDTLNFVELSQSPTPAYHEAQPVELAIDIGDGNGSVTRFKGEITDKQSDFGQGGWRHAYTALGLKYLADRVPITAVDGTGLQVYNRSPEDDYYVPSDSGLELGVMIRRLLENISTAQRLNAAGVGNYTGLPSAPALPASTLADLALLTIVPPHPEAWSGEGIFNQIDQRLSQWMPKWYVEVEPGGDIRFKDSTSTTTFVPRTVTAPGAGGPGDPVLVRTVRSSTQNCATRLVLRGGPQVEVATLSLVDGTLAEVFTSTDKTNWNLTYFTAPKGASDKGAITAVTSTSATMQSDDATVAYAANFWANNNGTLTLIDPTAPGITQMESRTVTSNFAMVAGGTASASWDATWPITGTAYSRYRIVGAAGGLVDTWRTYEPREPATGAVGLATFVGAHLVTRSAHVVKVANVVGTTGQYYTTALVVGGSLGQAMPLPVQAVPSAGMFRFTQPTVTVFGSTAFLNTGSPTTTAQGKPIDVIIYALYSRGPLSVTVPPDIAGVPQYEGTAYTDFGLDHTAYLDFPGWNWINDLTSFTALAQEHLDCRKNTEVDIDIDWMLSSSVPAWDFLSFGYCLNIAINGATSPWSALNAPVRTIGVSFDYRGSPSRLAASATTRRRAFAGDDLYIHPEFAQGSPLANATGAAAGNWQQYGDALAAGMVNPFGAPVQGMENYQSGTSGFQSGMTGFQSGLEGFKSGMEGFQMGLQLPQNQQPQFTLMDTLMAGMPVGPPPPGRARREKPELVGPPRPPPAKPGIDEFFRRKSVEERGEKQDQYHDMAERELDKQVARGRAERAREEAAERKKAEEPARRQERDQDLRRNNLDRQIQGGREREAIAGRNRQHDQALARARENKILKDAESKGQPLPGGEDLGQARPLDWLSPPGGGGGNITP